MFLELQQLGMTRGSSSQAKVNLFCSRALYKEQMNMLLKGLKLHYNLGMWQSSPYDFNWKLLATSSLSLIFIRIWHNIANPYASPPFLNKRDVMFHGDFVVALTLRSQFFENDNIFIHNLWLYFSYAQCLTIWEENMSSMFIECINTQQSRRWQVLQGKNLPCATTLRSLGWGLLQ